MCFLLLVKRILIILLSPKADLGIVISSSCGGSLIAFFKELRAD